MLMKKNVNNEVRKDSATRVKSRKHLRVENKHATESIAFAPNVFHIPSLKLLSLRPCVLKKIKP